MNRFWHSVILPILKEIDAKVIMEIGCAQGKNTKNIMLYCAENNGLLYAIDPFPDFDVQDFKNEYGDKFVFYQELSLSALPLIEKCDAILIDGDHNWYTVFNELKIIEKNAQTSGHFPLLFLHDVGWPYGRRDLYYNPENIPDLYRQPYKKQGLLPGQSGLVEHGGINAHLYNAIYENNPQNGVLTAVEDFLVQSSFELKLYKFSGLNGLGIVAESRDLNLNDYIKNVIFDSELVSQVEQHRLEEMVRASEKKLFIEKLKSAEIELVKKINSITEQHSQLLKQVGDFEDLKTLLKQARDENRNKDELLKLKGSELAAAQAEVRTAQQKMRNLEFEMQQQKYRLRQAQRTAEEYRNSTSFRLGHLIVKAIKPSKDTIKFPFAIIKLLKDQFRKPKKVEGKKVISHKIDTVQGQLQDNGAVVDIIVCVHNALEDVKECLESIYKKTDVPFRLIVVDDGSERETKDYLSQKAVDKGFILLRNDKARGYTCAANQGLKASKTGYCILLNSDTIVTRGWVKKLIECATVDKKTGIVGPLSNAASWQTVPEMMDGEDWKVNLLPDSINVELMASIVENASVKEFPKVPFINGFCFFIKREVIDKIGYLDEKTFPKGYGEENDYCLRAMQAGFELRVADHCYIFHEKSKSFTHETRKVLSKKASELLKEKYGKTVMAENVARMKSNTTLPQIRSRIKTILSQIEPRVKKLMSKSMLFILPVKGGGGGAHSVVQETMGLRECGFDVKIITDKKHLESFIKNYPEAKDFCLSFKDEENLIQQAVTFDIVVATIFNSVRLLKKVKDHRPDIIPGYYIQDYEPLFFDETDPRVEEAKESYNLISDIRAFAKTHWIRNTVKTYHDIEVHKVKPSLDTRLYNPYLTSVRPVESVIKIAAMIRPKTPRRAPRETLMVLKNIKEKYGDSVEINIFGCSDKELNMFGNLTQFSFVNHDVLKRWEVAELLKRSDVFLDMSTYQAFGRTGLEAMAVGCATILPEQGGTGEYAVNGKNCILVDTSDISATSKAIEQLITNKELLVEIKKNGIETAKNFSIRSAVWSEIQFLMKL